jgi:hypothetical protein
MPLFFTSINAFFTGSVVTIMDGCLTSPQLSNLFFTYDNPCTVLLIVYSMPYHTSVFLSASLGASISFPLGGGGGDVGGVKRNLSPVSFSLSCD